uniref:Uncharacterized protein n=1 Tax=Rhizophora mucronata TaxID=61149 RepID=A0A2P2NP22_RHIMU
MRSQGGSLIKETAAATKKLRMQRKRENLDQMIILLLKEN